MKLMSKPRLSVPAIIFALVTLALFSVRARVNHPSRPESLMRDP